MSPAYHRTAATPSLLTRTLRFCRWLAAACLALAVVPRGARAAGPVTVLHSFNSTDGNGSDPQGGVIFGADGSLYGTARNGGTNAVEGTIYRLTTAGGFTLLHAFANDGTEGGSPAAGLLLGQDGNLYGVAGGKLFRVASDGTLTVLHDFTGDYLTAGNDPEAALIQDGAGNFYGTSYQGGAYGYGTLFEYMPDGTATPLYAFSLPDGQGPLASLLLAADGNFYGTTAYGGAYGYGTVFRLTPAGVFTSLHSFSYNGDDGANPMAALIQGRDGNLYGTTQYGTANGSGNPGTVFRVTPAGVVSTVHAFTSAEGSYLLAALTEGPDGLLYGMASQGGVYGDGTVFRMTTDGTVTVLHNFTGSDGGQPASKLVLGADDFFYGTTLQGGTTNSGTVFRLDPNALAGSFQLAGAVYNVSEGAGGVALTVRRVGGTAGAVSVSYATADGTAASGVDYTGTTRGVVQWADGDGADKTVTVPILDAKVTDGGTRTFSLILSAPSGDATLGSPASASVNILDDDKESPPPVITIVSPPADITVAVGTPVPLAAAVTDPGGLLAQVQFFVNGQLYATTEATGPFATSAVAPFAGTFVLSAVATDITGRTSTSTVTITAIAVDAANPAPVATLVTPLDGRDLDANGTVTLDASADVSAAAGLDHVTIYVDGVPVANFAATDADGSAARPGLPTRRDAGTPLSSVFKTSYKLPGLDKILNMIVTATDKLGHTSISGLASFHSKVTTDRAPLVAIGGLANGTHVKAGAAATATVDASDPDAVAMTNARGVHRADAASDAALAKLEYYINGSLIAQATRPPFNFSFTPPQAGKYLLHAVATDGSGLATVSEPVTVEADAVASTVSLAVGGTGAAVEGGANGVVLVTRTGGDNGMPLTVHYKAKGAAVAGVDYKPLPGTITIPAGAPKAKIKIKPINGSPNVGTLKLKLQLLPSVDASYVVGTGTVKLKLIGR